MYEKLNFLGMEPWLSVRQADTLTAGQMMLTHVFYFLFLLVSDVNYFTGLSPNLSLISGTLESVRKLEITLRWNPGCFNSWPNDAHTRNCTKALKNAVLPWDRTLVVCTTSRHFNSLPNDACNCFLLFNSTY